MKKEQLLLSDVINQLLKLQRLDIDPQYNGEYTELEERHEEDGKYVKSEDIQELINKIRISNGL